MSRFTLVDSLSELQNFFLDDGRRFGRKGKGEKVLKTGRKFPYIEKEGSARICASKREESELG